MKCWLRGTWVAFLQEGSPRRRAEVISSNLGGDAQTREQLRANVGVRGSAATSSHRAQPSFQPIDFFCSCLLCRQPSRHEQEERRAQRLRRRLGQPPGRERVHARLDEESRPIQRREVLRLGKAEVVEACTCWVRLRSRWGETGTDRRRRSRSNLGTSLLEWWWRRDC